jgi:cell division protein FtsB
MKLILAILFVLLLALQFRLWTGDGSIAEISEYDAKIASQTAENDKLESRNEALLQEVSDLKTGLDSIEERARSELGMVKKGETFFLIVDEEPEP